MNPSQKEASDTAIKARPYLADLRSLLLSFGGQIVCDWNEGDIDEMGVFALIRFGTFWPIKRKKVMRGERNGCHTNAKIKVAKDPKRYARVLGFALCTDKMWHRHSWVFDFQEGITVDTIFAETTVKYFGHPYSPERKLGKVFAKR